jgi:PAS domain S-box-containing protein
MEDALTTLLMYRNLHDSEERLRVIIENTGAGYFLVDLDGYFQSVNASWLRMHGYTSADEIIGQHFSSTQVETDLHKAQMLVESLLSGEKITADEFSRKCKDGSVGYQSFSANPVVKEGKIVGLEGFLIDITEHKLAENALRESEEKYRKLVTTAPYGIQLTDTEGKILFSNPAHHKIQGYADGELIGKYIWDLMSDEDRKQKAQSYYQKIIQEQPNPKVYFSRDKTKDGREIDIQINWDYIYDSKGEIEGIISIISDITHQMRLEEEIRKAQRMESIGNLAGGIAHDFNNILASIIGFTELALDKIPKDTIIEDSLQEVYSAGKRAKELVKQILAFARQSDEKRSPIQPSSVAKEVLKFIRSTIPTSIEIRQDIESDAWIMGNTTQIHQVLMNLCTNAAHVMDEFGGVLEVSMKDLFFDKGDSLVDMRQGDYIEIKVSDTGAGIAPEIINSIFEPYFTTKGPGEGTGMGLAMVQGVIESYGGKISVISQLGKGTTFTIYLPITGKRKAIREYLPEQLPSGTERILFVDDELPIAKMGSKILETLGYSVTTRTSSIEALELFRVKHEAFDLVVTDMTMPNMTGDELAIELIKIRPNIPVILCTGYSKKISDEMVSEIGIKAFAYKPMVKAELAKTVRRVLDEANGTESQ